MTQTQILPTFATSILLMGIDRPQYFSEPGRELPKHIENVQSRESRILDLNLPARSKPADAGNCIQKLAAEDFEARARLQILARSLNFSNKASPHPIGIAKSRHRSILTSMACKLLLRLTVQSPSPRSNYFER